jgi:outer membrane protein
MDGVPHLRSLCLLVVLSGGCIFGQQAPLTLEDCIRRALSVASPVSLARKQQEIADRQVLQARAGFLPQGAIQAGHTYNSPNRQDRTAFSFVALNGIREFVGLGQIFEEIDTSGRLRAEFARARAVREAASAGVGVAERDLRRAVSSAYYRLLLARRLASAIRESLNESRQFAERTERLAASGEAARADVVKASAQAAFLAQALSSAELAADLANQELASYWTTEVDRPLAIVDVFDEPLPPPEAAPPEAAPFLRRPEFRLLDGQFRAFRAEARGARAELYPRLAWTFQYGLDHNKVAWNQRGYAAYLTLHIPVFDWFRSLNAARQFEARAAEVTDQRLIAERRFSQEYRSALARVKVYYEQVGLSRKQLALAEEDLKLSRIRYEGGEAPALDVVVAQNQLTQARTNYYTSVANYFNARLDLEVAAGR